VVSNALPKKANLTTDGTGLQAQNDPCKSVVISVICGEVFAFLF